MHLRSKSRGKLVLQSAEVFILDDTVELEAAERAMMALPLNQKPPAASTLSAGLTGCKLHTEVGVMPAGHTVNLIGRASLADVKARFNAEHTWSELLSDKGGTEVRGGWVCTCGYKHTAPLQIAIASQDKIVSFSPNCTWAPHRDSGKARDKFGFYVDQWHNGDVVAALKTLNPIVPRRASDYQRSDADKRARYSAEQRAAYNAAHKERRHQETRETLDAIYEAANDLEFTSALPAGLSAEAYADRARLLFIYLLGLAHERGLLQVAPTNQQISGDLDMCRRYVQYAFRELEKAGLGKRQGGRNSEGNEAAVWTLFRSPNKGKRPSEPAVL